ncbi:hypothetical protein DFJ73DRAFT_905186 [Zopfochytrium polystomum]|nr:hypothetical protein DFJ73DRAFT_905186 [Zopfochytrium polystomum]
MRKSTTTLLQVTALGLSLVLPMLLLVLPEPAVAMPFPFHNLAHHRRLRDLRKPSCTTLVYELPEAKETGGQSPVHDDDNVLRRADGDRGSRGEGPFFDLLIPSFSLTAHPPPLPTKPALGNAQRESRTRSPPPPPAAAAAATATAAKAPRRRPGDDGGWYAARRGRPAPSGVGPATAAAAAAAVIPSAAGSAAGSPTLPTVRTAAAAAPAVTSPPPPVFVAQQRPMGAQRRDGGADGDDQGRTEPRAAAGEPVPSDVGIAGRVGARLGRRGRVVAVGMFRAPAAMEYVGYGDGDEGTA